MEVSKKKMVVILMILKENGFILRHPPAKEDIMYIQKEGFFTGSSSVKQFTLLKTGSA